MSHSPWTTADSGADDPIGREVRSELGTSAPAAQGGDGTGP